MRVVSVLAVLAVLVAACGGSSEEPVEEATESSGAAAAASGVELPCDIEPDGTLAQILEDGVVNVALDGGYIPYAIVDEAGELTGIDVEMARMLWEPLGVEPLLLDVPFASQISAIQTGKMEIIGGSMSASEERMEQVAFSTPYSPAGSAIVTGGDNRIEDPKELDGATVGLQAGSFPVELAKSLHEDLVSEGGQGLDVREFPDLPILIQSVVSDKLDAIITSPTVMARFLAENPEQDLTVGVPLGHAAFSMVMSKEQDSESLLAYADCMIEGWREDGTLVSLHEEWFGDGYRAIEDLLTNMDDEPSPARQAF